MTPEMDVGTGVDLAVHLWETFSSATAFVIVVTGIGTMTGTSFAIEDSVEIIGAVAIGKRDDQSAKWVGKYGTRSRSDRGQELFKVQPAAMLKGRSLSLSVAY